eukprot:s1973_g2.t1
MKLHVKEGDVQVECMVLLQNLLGSPLPSGPSSGVHLATAEGVSEFLVQALRTFPQHRLVQLTAVRLLRTLVLGGTLLAGEKSFGKNFEDTEPDLGWLAVDKSMDAAERLGAAGPAHRSRGLC